MNDKRRDASRASNEDIVRELRATFREEANELLVELESALLALEKKPDDKDLIGRVFRALHTLKGSGGACEFHEIVEFTHELETNFDKIRSGNIKATHDVINLYLLARDQIKSMLNAYYLGGTVDDAKAASILAAFIKLLPKTAESVTAGPAPPKADRPEQEPSHDKTYRIRFRPGAQVLVQGTDPISLLNELRELGMCNVVAQTEDIPCLEDYDPRVNYTYWDVILTTDRGSNAIQDVFIFVKDTAEVKIRIIDDEVSQEDEMPYKYLGDILVERGDLTPEDMQKALTAKKRLGELLIETGIVPNSKVASALVEQQHVRDLRERRLGTEATSSIRVAIRKLDSLVNFVGELVTVQARLSRMAAAGGNPSLLSIAEEVERLAASLRENTMNMRMLPIGTTFSKFERVVRDLASKLGKEIDLTTGGAETELDKTVIERLGDPLVHIIRNSIDHGIELPAVRTVAGKPKKGTIHLSAVHSGAHVLIRVQDDGAGLDAKAIRSKAVEKGLVQTNTVLTEQELWELIFTPGFSTAENVSGVSGRGVGMDVVKKAIDALRGTLQIDSFPGRGTTITLKLPLTLAIIDGFLTKIAENFFIFELSSVQECIELTREETIKTKGRNLVEVRGGIIPYIRLRQQLRMGGEAPPLERIVIVEEEGRQIGFVVDDVIGEHQTVLKSLGKYYKDVEGISAATILGDGSVALVLDLHALIHAAELEEAAAIS